MIVFYIEWNTYHCWVYSLFPTSERLSYHAPVLRIFITYKACICQKFNVHFSPAAQLNFISYQSWKVDLHVLSRPCAICNNFSICGKGHVLHWHFWQEIVYKTFNCIFFLRCIHCKSIASEHFCWTEWISYAYWYHLRSLCNSKLLSATAHSSPSVVSSIASANKPMHVVFMFPYAWGTMTCLRIQHRLVWWKYSYDFCPVPILTVLCQELMTCCL
jgi:hypothetical protein